jgi:hypothetical protein
LIFLYIGISLSYHCSLFPFSFTLTTCASLFIPLLIFFSSFGLSTNLFLGVAPVQPPRCSYERTIHRDVMFLMTYFYPCSYPSVCFSYSFLLDLFSYIYLISYPLSFDVTGCFKPI